MVRNSILLTLWVVVSPVLAQPPSEEVRAQLCEQALRVGGPLEDYLAGVGLTDPAAVANATNLFDRLRAAHPQVPDGYVKLAVLMAAEGGLSVSAEAAEATLAILAGCQDEEAATDEPAAEPPAEEGPAAAEPMEDTATEDTATGDAVAETEAIETSPAETGAETEALPSVEEPPPVESPDAPPPPPPSIGDPRATFLEGVALADRGELEEAEALFRSLITTYPQLPEPYINLAAILADRGNELEAGPMAEDALLAHPVCRAAFELEMLQDFGEHSRSLLADLGISRAQPEAPRSSASRVVGPDWIPSPGQNLDEIRAIARVLNAWLDAWSKGRADDYLTYYSRNFQPTDGDRRLWQAERRRQLAATPTTELEISGLDVDVTSPASGTASFTLRSRPEGSAVAIEVDKFLELEKVGDDWMIVSERPGE